MKRLRRCCCVLLSFLLLSTVFCLSANAEDLEVKPYVIYQQFVLRNNYAAVWADTLSYTPNNGTQEKYGLAHEHLITDLQSYGDNLKIENQFQVSSIDGGVLFKAVRPATLRLYKVYSSFLVHFLDSETKQYFNNPQQIRVLVYYADGTQQYYDEGVTWGLTEPQSTRSIDITFNFSPPKDVVRVSFITYFDNRFLSLATDEDYEVIISPYVGEWHSDSSFALSLEQSTEEAGLLSGLIGKVTGLWDSVKNGFTDMLNSIAELPQKIWTSIENGLKGLFIPDEEYIATFKDKFDTLLSDRFGAVYEVGSLVNDLVSQITYSGENKDIITIPEATIPLGNDIDFTFGGYDVDIVPNGFEWLVDMIKIITSGVCVFLFINGMLKRYDEIMGVE